MKASGLSVTRTWVANDLANVSSSVCYLLGLLWCHDVALEEVVIDTDQTLMKIPLILTLALAGSESDPVEY